MNAISLPTPEQMLHAKLPALYVETSQHLAKLSKLDECQDWADKAAALCSYAKQADDDTLEKYAQRIRARAVRRGGELLKTIPVSSGGRPSETRGDASPSLTRTQTARDAGMSDDQRKNALRVASLDKDEFEVAIESDDPPTITELARAGTKHKPLVDLVGISPGDYADATAAQGFLRSFADFCKKHDAIRIAASFKPHEIKSLRDQVHTIDGWLDKFIVNLGN